jgi:hypothetical protein
MAEREVEDVAADTNAIDRLASIFATDTILASQFNDMRRASVGDHGIAKLWLAVLEDGIRCFMDSSVPDGNGAAWHTRRWRLQQEAREWIFESDYEGPFSFKGLCEALGIDASYLREGLTRRGGQIDLPRKSPVTYCKSKLITRSAMGRL